MKRRAFLFTPLALLAAPRRPNAVLAVARGWRGVSVPWAGDPDIRAPRLERFARDSIVLPRAWCASPSPGRAMEAILSGLFPHAGAGPRIDAAFKQSGYAVATSNDDSGLELIRKHRDQPFFIYTRLDGARTVSARDGAAMHPRENVPPEDAAKARVDLARRYAAYAAMDAQFGALLDALEAAGAASNTIVVFTSDAGEQAGSHGIFGDDVFYEESARVPLAIRWPEKLAGAASDLSASHVDLAPTILALCGLDPLDGSQGRDLSPLLLGKPGDRPESVFAEGKIGERNEWRMLVLGFDKLVVDRGGEPAHLFNLASDPYELNDLAREPGAKLKRDELTAVMRATRSRLLDFRRR